MALDLGCKVDLSASDNPLDVGDNPTKDNEVACGIELGNAVYRNRRLDVE